VDQVLSGEVDFTEPLDLLVVGAELIEPAGKLFGHYDIGVRSGVIAEIAQRITRPARVVLDARGYLLTPGLVDLHTHIFAGAGYWSIDAPSVAWRTGTTTWIDAGSAGAYSFGAFRRVAVEGSPLRVRALLHISALGLIANAGEARDIDLCDPGLCAEVIEQHRDVIVGVKCRLSEVAAGDHGLELLRRSIAAGEKAGVPVMVHIGNGSLGIDAVLEMLRPGDIVTHCTTAGDMTLVTGDRKIRPSALSARERGVLFDVGHGSGAFSFDVVETCAEHGFWPDTISSDLHQKSILGPAFDLPTCLSKLVAVGMPLREAIAATTTRPAAALGLSGLGRIELGGPADLALFELREGTFDLFDTGLRSRTADRLLVNRATFVGGRELEEVQAAAPAPWVRTTPNQAEVLKSTGRPRLPWAMTLNRVDDFVPLDLKPNCSGLDSGLRSTGGAGQLRGKGI
jgi:dihydroorotase